MSDGREWVTPNEVREAFRDWVVQDSNRWGMPPMWLPSDFDAMASALSALVEQKVQERGAPAPPSRLLWMALNLAQRMLTPTVAPPPGPDAWRQLHDAAREALASGPRQEGTPPSDLMAQLEAAHAEVCRVHKASYSGNPDWRISIPARPDHDSDLIIGGALRAAMEYVRASRVEAAPEQGEPVSALREAAQRLLDVLTTLGVAGRFHFTPEDQEHFEAARERVRALLSAGSVGSTAEKEGET